MLKDHFVIVLKIASSRLMVLFQVEAAQSLSQLEKLAISNYSEFLGDNNKSKEKVVGYDQRFRGDRVGDQVAEKFSKFADSLMRQRQMQQSRRSVIRSSYYEYIRIGISFEFPHKYNLLFDHTFLRK